MIHDSQVFFASWSKNYHSLDLKTGKENWQSFMVNQIQTSLTLVPGENIGITNAPIGEIVGINLEDGTIAWRLRHGDRNNQFSVLVTQNPDKQGHYLAWSRCKESQLCTLDAKTGKLIYNMDLPGLLPVCPLPIKNAFTSIWMNTEVWSFWNSEFFTGFKTHPQTQIQSSSDLLPSSPERV